MELEESTCLTSDYTTKPQSSRQYGTGTKTEILINGTRWRAQRQMDAPMGSFFCFCFFLTKEVRIYNGAKTASSMNGGGKTGQLHIKE